jgi:hypothetical protein
MAYDFSPETLRSRFAELTADRDAKLAVSGPLRDQRDTLVRDHALQVAALDAQIADTEAGLFDLDQERAMISRALGGKTGEPE